MFGLEEALRSYGLSQMASEILTAVIILSVAAIAGLLAYYFFARYIANWAKATKTTVDDSITPALKVVVILAVLLAGSYYALGSLSLVMPYAEQLAAFYVVLGIILAAFTLTKIASILTDWYSHENTKRTGRINNHVLFLLKKVFQLIVYVIAFLAILTVFGVNLSAVVVGLGVGGIAIALAVQNTLGDVFSAFSIYFDRPFEIGDFIVVGEYSGTVTNIGVRSTRIKLLQGEELVMSNRQLTTSCVRNFKKLEKRRVTFTIGVTYDTPAEKLKRIPQIIAKIFDRIELAQLDRVHFTEFGDFSLKFEVVYYVNTADYNKYMDTQQAINYSIMEEFEKDDIQMAFPTQTILVKRDLAEALQKNS
jgi:small-conductance mechanosensitive channel